MNIWQFMKKTLVISGVGLCLLVLLSFVFIKEFYVRQQSGKMNIGDTSLYYIYQQAKKPSAKSRLLLILHGRGANEQDLFFLAGKVPDDVLVVSIRAPYAFAQGDGQHFQWFDVDRSIMPPVYNMVQEKKTRLNLEKFIMQLNTKFSFDPAQVYIFGFSQGAMMAYDIGLTDPGLIRGFAAMSGKIIDEVKPEIAPDDQLKKLRIFISQGTKDNVIEPHFAKDAVALLQQHGVTPTYHEYPEGHNISQTMVNDFLKWLGEK